VIIVEEMEQHLADYYADMLSGGATEAEAYRQSLDELESSEMLVTRCNGAGLEARHEANSPRNRSWLCGRLRSNALVARIVVRCGTHGSPDICWCRSIAERSCDRGLLAAGTPSYEGRPAGCTQV